MGELGDAVRRGGDMPRSESAEAGRVAGRRERETENVRDPHCGKDE